MTSTINYERFFKFSDPFGTQALRLGRVNDAKWLNKETVIKLAHGELAKTKEVMRLHGYMGRRPMDFLWTGFPPLRCISERVVALLKQNGVTGWSTYSVEVYDRDDNLLPGYHGFAVVGRAGDFKRELSTIITVTSPSGMLVKRYKGLYFAPANWDGSDIFLLSRSKIIVTQKVQQIFKKAKVNNVLLTPLPEVELDVSLWKN